MVCLLFAVLSAALLHLLAHHQDGILHPPYHLNRLCVWGISCELCVWAPPLLALLRKACIAIRMKATYATLCTLHTA